MPTAEHYRTLLGDQMEDKNTESITRSSNNSPSFEPPRCSDKSTFFWCFMFCCVTSGGVEGRLCVMMLMMVS